MAACRVIPASRTADAERRVGWVVERREDRERSFVVSVLFATREEAIAEEKRLTEAAPKQGQVLLYAIPEEAAARFRRLSCMRMLAWRQIRWAVETQHGCKAVPIGEVTVHENVDGSTLWYGVVTIFELHGHAKASWAYAWFYELPGSHGRQFLSALHAGRVIGPAEAIRAAIAAMK